MILSKFRITTLLVSGLILFLSALSIAEEFPNPVGFINDYSSILTQQERNNLESICRAVKKRAGVEFAVITMDEIPDGQAISSYTVDIAHHWGVGNKSDDKGVVLLYSTGKSDGKRQVYLATGYGIEGDIPDSRAGRILDQVTIPLLREERNYQAFAATISTVLSIVSPETRISGIPEPQVIPQSDRRGKTFPGILIMIFIVMMLILPRGSRGLFFVMMLGSMMGRSHGGWGSSGGGFSGGFGGFGGGGFGGGGAGRSF